MLPVYLSDLAPSPILGDTFELTGDEAHHAAAVRRMRVGEQIQITNGSGMRVTGTITITDKNRLVISVSDVFQEAKPAILLTLVQAIAKNDRDELSVQSVGEIGLAQVIPWAADRSISKWDAAKAQKNQRRWQQIADEAMKQSLQAWRPVVLPMISSKELPNLASQFDLMLILDPTAPETLVSVSQNLSQPGLKVAMVIGPEGGITEGELESFSAAGALRVRLGESVLRTSTAAIVAAAAIQGKAQGWC